MYYNLNGYLIEGDQLSIPLSNRALNYGDGVFESMRYSNGQVNFWEDHYFRLMASMRIVRLEIPLSFSPEFLEAEIEKTLKANDISSVARIRLMVFRKSGGLYTPLSNEVDYLLQVTALPEESAEYSLNEKGLVIDLYKDHLLPKGLLSTVKSMSAQFYAIASIYRHENGLDECVLLNSDKMVCEAISANLFVVRDGVVITPPLMDGCLKGVMRKNAIRLLKEIDVEVLEQSFSPFEIQKADELFLTNASRGVRWVGQYRKKQFGNSLSQKLVEALNQVDHRPQVEEG